MKKRIAWLLAAVLLLGCCAGCGAAKSDTERAADKAAAWLLKTAEPEYGSEWLAVCFAGWDVGQPKDWLDSYRNNITQYIAGRDGKPDWKKCSEYSSVLLAVTAAGGDGTDVGGLDLTAVLSDSELVTGQGLNNVIYALIALDSGDYASDARDGYVDFILSRQLPDGGFSFGGTQGDPDMTAMALQALSGYQSRADVAAAVQAAVERLSALQGEDGRWNSWGTVNSESCAQTVIALGMLGIPLDDGRFVKNGCGLLADLLSYQLTDGSFSHTVGGESNSLATRQALEALVTALKAEKGQGGLFALAGTSCTLEIRCDVLAADPTKLAESKRALVPADGVILAAVKAPFTPGETVFDVLRRELTARNIHFEFEDSTTYQVAYIEGIANLYEYDAGELSGWEYSVNGVFPGVGCGGYTLSDGDYVLWQYTCDLGADIGNARGDA